MKDNNREEKMTAYWTYLDFLRGRVSGSEFYDAALATAVAADKHTIEIDARAQSAAKR